MDKVNKTATTPIPKTLQSILQNTHNTQKALAEYITKTDTLHAAQQKLICDTIERIEFLESQISGLPSLRKQYSDLTASYNKSIEVINDLSKRLTDLEANYDPTIIK